MLSNFGGEEENVPASGGSVGFVDEFYGFRGLNLKDPDQTMPAGESPYTINSRSFAVEDGQSRVASRTRKGSSRLSVAVGETLDTQNVATVTDSDNITSSRILAQQFTATGSGNLTRLDLELSKNSGAFGHVILHVCVDNGGLPGGIIAGSSVLGNTLTTSGQFLSAYCIDAPALTAGVSYWIVAYIQDNGSGSYFWNKSATGTKGRASNNGGLSWDTSPGTFRFKTYLATAQPVKGYARRYPSTGSNLTLVAAAGSVYSVTDAGVTAVLDSALDSSATKVRFITETFDDKTVWLDGTHAPRYTDNGTTVQDLPGVPVGATHGLAYNNRMFLLYANQNKLIYSDILNPISYPAVNFAYFPNPKSTDRPTAILAFQGKIFVFTHKTKYYITGSDVSTFQRNEAVGTKGAVSQEAVAVDRNYIYFMADDGRIYRYNGISDELISDNVQPETQGILDKSSVRLHIYNNQLRVYYHKSPDTTNNRMLLFDIDSKQWYMDTGRCVAGSLSWDQDANQLIEFSSRCTWVFQGEQGYSDVGKAIAYKYWTNYKSYGYRRRTGQSFGGGATKKRVKFFRPVVRVVAADYTLSVGKDMDFANNPDMRAYVISSGGAKWGSFVWGDGTKWGGSKLVDKRTGMSGRGHHIQYRFEREGVETPVELYGYIASIKIGKAK